MFLERIERHDVVNAIMLAAVLLLFGFGILSAANSFFATASDGVIATARAEDEVGSAPAGATTSVDTTAVPTTLPPARPPAEVTVRVANGARRPGVAGAGTERLNTAGYPTLAPKNGPTMDDSVVYYTTGFAAEAAAVAVALGLEPSQIEPVPSDPGVALDGANVLAILGVNSDY